VILLRALVALIVLACDGLAAVTLYVAVREFFAGRSPWPYLAFSAVYSCAGHRLFLATWRKP
jgi:hypothetical protein